MVTLPTDGGAVASLEDSISFDMSSSAATATGAKAVARVESVASVRHALTADSGGTLVRVHAVCQSYTGHARSRPQRQLTILSFFHPAKYPLVPNRYHRTIP